MRPRLKENTWLTKESIIQSKILPYLGQRKMSEITAKDVIDWQNAMRSQKGKTGKTVSPTYLKTIHGQLSSIFNHAIRYYDLNINPARKEGTMGAEESKEMLYWCGIREGELLALTPVDFDFDNQTVTINKSYQRLKGRDVITSPKTM